MVEIDPRGWLLKEIKFAKSDEENLFQLEHAACVLGRLSAAEALIKKARTNSKVAEALAAGLEAGEGARHPARALCHSCAMARRCFARPSSKEPRTMSPACGLPRSAAWRGCGGRTSRKPFFARRGTIPGSRTARAKPRFAVWSDGE